MNRTEEYLIELLRCALQGQQPSKKPDECSWNTLWQLACKNNVESIVSPAIRQYSYEIPDSLAGKWRLSLDKNLNRLLKFQIEREMIFAELEKKGIAYLPLKGILLAEYYPVPGMRWMSDNDILFGYVKQDISGKWYFQGETQQKQTEMKEQAASVVYQIMGHLGYQREKYRSSHHDAYHKLPIYNFEMHQSLVPDINSATEYYKNPWEKTFPVEEGKHLFAMKDEDVYIYHIVHAYKHFDNSGCGIRTLADEYVLLTHNDKMDWEYIVGELKKLELASFEKQLRKTAEHAFSLNGVMDEDDRQFAKVMIGSGTYGSLDYKVERHLERIALEQQLMDWRVRLVYIRDRMKMDDSLVKTAYPFFYRHPRMRIFLPFWRVVRGLVVHPGKLWHEWQLLNRYRKKN